MTKKQEIAAAFIEGYNRARLGYSIEELAEAIFLTREEWEVIKKEKYESIEGSYLKDLDTYFKTNNTKQP